MIELRDLHLTLNSSAGPVKILRGIDFTLTDGEAVGLVGPSGSGKSTLLGVIAGLERPSGGLVRVGGVTLCGPDEQALGEDALARFRRGRLGIVFQSFHLIATMTALENVAVPLELAGRRDAFAVARRELEAVGLGDRLGHYPAQLSGGEQQRVAIARAVAPNPALLLADEPTGNLDQRTGEAIIRLIFDLHRARGATLLLITHDPSLAAACDRVVHLRDGRLVTAPAGSDVEG